MKIYTDKDHWIRCGACGHKLGKLISSGTNKIPTVVEIKCHSCKTLNIWVSNDGNVDLI